MRPVDLRVLSLVRAGVVRTRRSPRNQDRLYRAIGRDLERAARAAAETEPALPGEVGAVRAVENPTPVLDAPFSLSLESLRDDGARQGDLFQGLIVRP